MKKAFSLEYWNNKKIEKNKIFYVKNNNINALKTNPKLFNYFSDFETIVKINNCILKNRNVTSFGCGSCWLEAQIQIKYDAWITGYDFSKHRINRLAKLTIKGYKADPKRFKLLVGDMHNTTIRSASQDLVVMCQSLHHSTNPRSLIAEALRILKPTGRIIVLGEPSPGLQEHFRKILVHFIKFILINSYRSRHGFFPTHSTLFPPCAQKGDIHYSKSDYYFMFNLSGLEFKLYKSKNYNKISFWCWKK